MTMDSSRRNFIKNATVLGGAAQVLPVMNVRAADGLPKKFKVGVVGCGGRGSGAMKNMLDAAKLLNVELEIVAMADVQKDKIEAAATKLGVAADKCYLGYDAYRKVMESPAQIVIMATPPAFRPVHFEAAVQAKKHCFIEKPVAVDPPGARRMLAAGAVAEQQGLSVVAGTQRRHTDSYIRNARAIHGGAIGNITGGTVMWCMGELWFKEREPGESDASYMIRNWPSFTEMSGDHIVEQHIHNIDVANWFIGRTPMAALGFGGRARRQTGNQFDFFSVDFDYGNNCHIHSMCRQVHGCYGRVGEYFIGTQGTAWGNGKLESHAGQTLDIPPVVLQAADGMVQEHVDLLDSVIQGRPVNTTVDVVNSTLSAIMGRIAAYTGQLVRWSDLTAGPDAPYYNLTLAPKADDFEKGPVTAPAENVAPIPGSAADPAKRRKR